MGGIIREMSYLSGFLIPINWMLLTSFVDQKVSQTEQLLILCDIDCENWYVWGHVKFRKENSNHHVNSIDLLENDRTLVSASLYPYAIIMNKQTSQNVNYINHADSCTLPVIQIGLNRVNQCVSDSLSLIFC